MDNELIRVGSDKGIKDGLAYEANFYRHEPTGTEVGVTKTWRIGSLEVKWSAYAQGGGGWYRSIVDSDERTVENWCIELFINLRR